MSDTFSYGLDYYLYDFCSCYMLYALRCQKEQRECPLLKHMQRSVLKAKLLATGVLHSNATWRTPTESEQNEPEITPVASPEEEAPDEQRTVHVKIVKLSDSAAASSAWRELVMLLQVCFLSHEFLLVSSHPPQEDSCFEIAECSVLSLPMNRATSTCERITVYCQF